jgi:hypothetical protein
VGAHLEGWATAGFAAMTGPRTWVRLDWEADGSAYLAISRTDQPVERIPLSTAQVARILADGAYLWSVIEPRRQGSLQKMQGSPAATKGEDMGGELPHFIGAWGE